MAQAGEKDTFRGLPPSFASARLPGVCTDSVGIPLALLCRDRKINSSGLKRSPRNWVSTISVLTKSSLVSLLCSVFVYTGLLWKVSESFSKLWCSMSCLAMFIPAVSSVEAMNSINVVFVPERSIEVIGRLRFSWKRKAFENMYSVKRLNFIEHLFWILKSVDSCLELKYRERHHDRLYESAFHCIIRAPRRGTAEIEED